MFKVALCQMQVVDDKRANIRKAKALIKEAKENGAKMVVLPEMFNCPYSNDYFKEYAEDLYDGITVEKLTKYALNNNVYLVGGSIPENDNGKIYNTSLVISDEGNIIGKHRKIHLFDVDVENGIKFLESETLSGGEGITIVDTPIGKVGICICYDIRFPELARVMALKGARMIIVPAAFNMTTGPVHWETTMKARAIDNQVYVAAAAPARNENGPYVSYGHSLAVDPWGNVICEAGEGEEIIYFEYDDDFLKKVRRELPLLRQRKEKVYKDIIGE